jgi:hypothetical protein
MLDDRLSYACFTTRAHTALSATWRAADQQMCESELADRLKLRAALAFDEIGRATSPKNGLLSPEKQSMIESP